MDPASPNLQRLDFPTIRNHLVQWKPAIISNHIESLVKLSTSHDKLVTLYCDYGSQAIQTLDEVERSIFHQILDGMPRLPQEIYDLHQKTKDGFSPLLSDLHGIFRSSSIEIGTIFVVLDALDEATEDVQNGLIARISRLPFADVRLLCISRPSTKLERKFQSHPHIQIRASDADITTFVRHRISDSPRLHDVVGQDEALKQTIATEVSASADGMFLMARHHLESLFAAASKTEIRRTLEHLPSTVGDVYKDTMNRISRQPKNDALRAQRTLSWVFGAFRRLTVDEIQHALAVLELCQDAKLHTIDKLTEDDLPHLNTIESCCQGLLIREEGYLLPCHHTASEYFRAAYSQWFPQGHADIATVCSAYLLQHRLQRSISRYLGKLRAMQQGSSSSGLSEYEAWALDDKLMSRYELLSYAGSYWGTHVWEAGHHADLEERMQSHRNVTHWWMNLDLSGSLQLHKTVELIINVQTSVRTLRKIVDQGGDINALDQSGQTMLSQAIGRHDTDAASFLLTLHGLHINIDGHNFMHTLTSAVSLGNETLLALITHHPILKMQSEISESFKLWL
ncbi:hypothetical protein GCG54_00015166 [Colletotrichum gloeosporioides]|uniref:Nephrocystin 3-like N-terminal domain-containing protein n=1 Tax=Colletotrichum gloeosporioides TaxID=474922 RepID=A0A8H4CDN2_COLGL|nr:uncharacterized protein GCG54_00015166 [Colletotrichum gloeosporioides]KAF3801944.1 hypothetical protein GCG54_00015166 [Colletotrichum gloeosporioides]